MSVENTIPPPEPEEAVEAALVATLAAVCAIPVHGFSSTFAEGTVKNISADTYILVKVDQTSQDGDYQYRAPVTFAASACVRFSQADEASGTTFREECRKVRAALLALTGDGCMALDTEGSFNCDAFTLDATSSDFEGGDNPTFTKAYSATVKGRIINQATEA